MNDEQAAADACSSLLQDSSMRIKYGEDARLEVVEKYQESVWENKILNFYGEIIPGFNYRKRENPEPTSV